MANEKPKLIFRKNSTLNSSAISFEKFFAMANGFYKSIGVQAYERSDGKRRSYLLDVIFFISMANMHFVLLSESTYVLLAFRNNSNFLEATMNLSYIGFVFVGDIKIWNIWYHKKNLTQIMRDLEAIYPKDAQMQRDYGVSGFLQTCNRITFGFALIHLLLIWTYNLYPMVTYVLYDYLMGWRNVEPTLPYFSYVPWNWHGHWSYYLLYISQDFAGHTCMNGQIASDVMLSAAVTQVIMHYQYLGKRIGNYVANCKKDLGKIGSSDLEFLKQLVDHHQKILSLSDAINEVFGISLLVAFLTSSFVMCFLGFQMTVGAAIDAKVMLFLFLFCSLVQVYMISNYAQELIIASESIGYAAYNHDWNDGDVRYKKMLLLIIKRAQKPAILKATTFLNISLGTMADLLQLSYKFFALLSTMYSK